MKKGTKGSNELEFQGQVVHWLSAYIDNHPGLSLEAVTQEKPHTGTGKRNDLVVWRDRAAEIAFLTVELKTPTTPINDPVFFSDALAKGRHWHSRYFALWNMRECEVYETTPAPLSPLPSDAILKSVHPLAVTQVSDWIKPAIKKDLEKQAVGILDAAIQHSIAGIKQGHAIDPELFVTRLTDAIASLRNLLYRDLRTAAGTSKKLRKALKQIAAEQGFEGFVEDIDYAIAGQIGYRFIGQILFYFALRRKIHALKPLKIESGDTLPDAFIPFWNEVRRYDYEALFTPEAIESLVPIAKEGQRLLRRLIDQLSSYDWASLTDDVLGSIFERLIPREQQHLLGQFYTPRPVADLLVASTLDGKRPFVIDPACGSGTFLMSAYSFLAHGAQLPHKELLSIIWGFDVSPFAAELAVINLYRQDMAAYENFPRINVTSFFDREPGQTIQFPASQHASGTKKVPVPVPSFDCVIGNPPYLRSQNQDDLDPGYRAKLFQAAMKAGFEAGAKTDLFAFFIYHSTRFMKEGGRLGFVTPASWLTSDYAIALQNALLGSIRVTSIVSSIAEAFFPQVDVNAVLLVAEKTAANAPYEAIRFITLKMPIARLTDGKGEYWTRVTNFAEELEDSGEVENDRYRVKLVDAKAERDALRADKSKPRNWSKYLRAPLSYYQLFGDH